MPRTGQSSKQRPRHPRWHRSPTRCLAAPRARVYSPVRNLSSAALRPVCAVLLATRCRRALLRDARPRGLYWKGWGEFRYDQAGVPCIGKCPKHCSTTKLGDLASCPDLPVTRTAATDAGTANASAGFSGGGRARSLRVRLGPRSARIRLWHSTLTVAGISGAACSWPLWHATADGVRF